MTKEPLQFIFSAITGIFSGRGRCDGCRRIIENDAEGGFFFLTWEHSEHSNQCIKDFTGLKKLPDVIALCEDCGYYFVSRQMAEILKVEGVGPLALRCIKAKDQIGNEFYKMGKEGKSPGEALNKVCSTCEAAFFPTQKRHIEEKAMKKREAEEIDKVEQEMLLEARRKWELRRIAEEKRVLEMKTQVPEHAIEERESMINDSLEKPKKKKLFQKIISNFGVGGVVAGDLAATAIQFILHGLVAVCGLGAVIYGISLIVHKETLLGLATIFIFGPIVATIAYFASGIIFAIVFVIVSGGYYLVKAIGRLFSTKKK